MTRYRYNSQVHPPAPFVHVTLQRINGATALADLPAQLDTAADVTVVPAALVEEMGLVPFGTMQVAVFGGALMTLWSYLVRLQIHEQEPVVMKILSNDDEPHVLLGRNVLNQHRVLLDGPNGVLEFE